MDTMNSTKVTQGEVLKETTEGNEILKLDGFLIRSDLLHGNTLFIHRDVSHTIKFILRKQSISAYRYQDPNKTGIANH